MARGRSSIYSKLTTAYLIGGLILAGFGWYQIQLAHRFEGLFADFSGADARRLQILTETKAAELEIRSGLAEYERDMLLRDTSSSKAKKTSILTAAQKLEDSDTAYRVLQKADVAKIESSKIEDAANAASALSATVRSVVNDITPQTSTATYQRLSSEVAPLYDRFDKAIAALSVAEQEAIRKEANLTSTATTDLIRAALTLSISGVVMALMMAAMLSIWISRPLRRLREEAERLANGDFTRTLAESSRDVFGDLAHSFNQMADRLRESYRRLALRQQQDEAMLQSIGEGVIALGTDAKITLINKFALNFLGVKKASDVIGVDYLKQFSIYEEHAAEHAQPLKPEDRPGYKALVEGRSVSGIYQFRKASGERYLLSAVASPVVLDGKTMGVVMVLRDVTKEREIDRMKTEFISLASHQLRTPLSAIKWFTEMLMSGDAGELKVEQKDFVKNVSDSTERMIELVNALLNISRIESGRIMVTPRPTDLKELVMGIVNELQPKIKEKQQVLAVSVHAELPKVNLDPQLIRQVYLNLLTNAIKYTPKKGEITVLVSRKGDDLISQVTDNGYGIPKAQQGRMFEKFFRATNVSKTVTDGTGLGMYLTKAVVESSGGKIWFQSEEGKGTTFWFSIPMTGMKAKEGEVTLDV